MPGTTPGPEIQNRQVKTEKNGKLENGKNKEKSSTSRVNRALNTATEGLLDNAIECLLPPTRVRIPAV